MRTIIKNEDTAKVFKDLKSRVKEAESSKSLTLKEVISRSAAWKRKYK